MKKLIAKLNAETSYCIYCRGLLTTTQEEKQGYHSKCQAQIADYQTSITQLKFHELILYYGLSPTTQFTINKDGDITALNLAGLGLTEFPPKDEEIRKLLVHIQKLDLSNNPLDDLGEDIKLFTNLRTLYLHACYFRGFPTNIKHLTKLEKFSVSEYDLTFPCWFIERVFEGLDVWASTGFSPDINDYEPLRLFAGYELLDFKYVDKDLNEEGTNHGNTIETLMDARDQLQIGIEKLTGIINILQTYPNHKFHLQDDVGYMMMRGEVPIIRDLVNHNIAQVSCQEKIN